MPDQNTSPLTYTYVDLEKLHARIHRKKGFFPGQRENETVKLCVRTHWLRKAVVAVYFLGLVILAPLLLLSILSLFDLTQKYRLLAGFGIAVYLLFALLFVFIEFIKNELTVLVVTNERVVNIAQISLFNQQISEANLNRIQEITGNTRGVLGTFLGVGRLEIQTAGTEMPLIIRYVKHPHFTARKIMDIQKKGDQRQRASDLSKRQNDPVRVRNGDELSPEEILKMRKSQQQPSENYYHMRKEDEEGLGG